MIWLYIVNANTSIINHRKIETCYSKVRSYGTHRGKENVILIIMLYAQKIPRWWDLLGFRRWCSWSSCRTMWRRRGPCCSCTVSYLPLLDAWPVQTLTPCSVNMFASCTVTLFFVWVSSLTWYLQIVKYMYYFCYLAYFFSCLNNLVILSGF